MKDYLSLIKYIRHQVGDCVKVEFLNGSMACSCTMTRGNPPSLRDE